MTLLFTDGFELYPSNVHLAINYPSMSGTNIQLINVMRTGNRGLWLYNSADPLKRQVASADEHETFISGCAVLMQRTYSIGRDFMFLGSDAGTTAATVRPSGGASVIVHWIGSVEPTNALNNDLWTNTT